jgi:hypothetical protein
MFEPLGLSFLLIMRMSALLLMLQLQHFRR